MDINAAFPSKYLKAADLGQSEYTLTIHSVQIENVGAEGSEEHKPVLWFNEAQKGMVLNKTNAEQIAYLYGNETDGWIGKPVVLFTMMVAFQGRNVPALRIRAAAQPQQAAQQAQAPLGPPQAGNGPVNVGGTIASPPTNPAAPGGPLPELGSDDIPFAPLRELP